MIFLYGSPRSGTTWLGKILDSHPDTLLRHEPDTIKRGDYPYISEDLFVEEARRHVSELLNCRNPKVTGTRPIFRKNYLPAPVWALKSAIIYGVKACEQFLPPRVVPDIPDMAIGGKYETVIKTVSILGRVPSISKAVPEAKFIHILRHPCGHTHSVLKGRKSGHLPSETYFDFANSAVARSYGLTFDDISRMTPPLQVAWRWAIMNEIALRAVPQAYVLVYDDFCRAPSDGARNLMNAIGLPLSAQTEAYLAQSNQEERGYFDTRRDPLVAAEKWRHEFEAADEVISALSGTRAYQYFKQHDAQMVKEGGS